MKAGKKRWLKISAGITGVIVLFIAVVIIFISPIAKYVIQKYDMQILGRKIRLSWVYINPFSGYVHIHNLKVYEQNGDTLFFTCKGVSANFAMLKMLKKTYEIENITLDHPWGTVIQNHKAFNFDDFIVRWSPKDTAAKKKPRKPLHFNILNIAIKNGEFHYIAQSIPASYYIKNVNIESPGKWWNVDSMVFTVALSSGPSTGDLKGKFSLDFDSLNYHAAVKLDNYDLAFLDQYLQDIAEYGNFTALLDADVLVSGNLGHKLAIATSGQVGLRQFHFGKVEGDDYVSFDKLALHILDVEPMNYKYNFDTVMLYHPYFKYERYDYLDNLQRMFGKGGSTYAQAKADSTKFNPIIAIANYLEDLAKNFVKSYYRANKVAIYNGDIRFNDFSLREKFSISANPLNLISDTIDKKKDRMRVALRTGIKPFGSIAADLSLDPNDYGFFDLNYGLGKVPLAMFNPYVISYTSFPLDKGTLEFNGRMNVEDSIVNSDNHLLIVDPRVSKRLKKKDTKWIPVPLILSVVREPGGGIDYDIPIKGSLSDPKFKLKYIIGDIIKNIFVKPPTTPYLVHVIDVQKEVEKLFTIKWATRQTELTAVQKRFTDKMVSFLKATPDAVIHVLPLEFAAKEKEYILFYQAKKKYYLLSGKENVNAFTSVDSIKVDKMSVKDSDFVHYLDKVVPDSMMFTIQEKCYAFLGSKIVDTKFDELERARENSFLTPFRAEGVTAQIKMDKGKQGIPYNGFSYYRIDYNGDFPKSLIRAYSEMYELNENAPRSKFKKERQRPGTRGHAIIRH